MMLDALLNTHLADGQPTDDFDATLRARLQALMDAEDQALDAALGSDAPTPSAGFDAAFRALLDAEQAAEAAALDALLDVDAPRPSDAFNATVAARMAAEDAARVNTLLSLDSPGPSAGFDASMKARLADADRGAQVLPFRRLLWIALPLAAAAALFVWTRPTPNAPEPLPAEPAFAAASQLEMLEDLELLEHLDEIAVLDGIEDPEIFAMVAQLDTLAPDPLPEALP